MKSYLYSKKFIGTNFLLALCMLLGSTFIGNLVNSQQLKIRDFTLFSGATGSGTTLIGSSITVNNGSVGAYKLVQTTGNATINANIYSGDKIIITNSNVVKGNIAAAALPNYPALSPVSAGTIFSVGSSTSITGNINVNGNVNIGGGTVTGQVTIPVGSTYIGPAPSGGVTNGTPEKPILPGMPGEKPFPGAGATNITGTDTKIPGNYGTVTYSGNKTLTLDGGGVYVFNSFNWTGNSARPLNLPIAE